MPDVPENQTSRTSVRLLVSLHCLSSSCRVCRLRETLDVSSCTLTCRNSWSLSSGGHRFALNFALRSSRDTACLKYLILLLDIVNGRRCGIKPTEVTVSLFEGGKVQEKFTSMHRTHQTPRNSTSTSTEKAFLKAELCSHPNASSWVYILYANGTCSLLSVGRSPT